MLAAAVVLCAVVASPVDTSRVSKPVRISRPDVAPLSYGGVSRLQATGRTVVALPVESVMYVRYESGHPTQAGHNVPFQSPPGGYTEQLLRAFSGRLYGVTIYNPPRW